MSEEIVLIEEQLKCYNCVKRYFASEGERVGTISCVYYRDFVEYFPSFEKGDICTYLQIIANDVKKYRDGSDCLTFPDLTQKVIEYLED